MNYPTPNNNGPVEKARVYLNGQEIEGVTGVQIEYGVEHEAEVPPLDFLDPTPRTFDVRRTYTARVNIQAADAATRMAAFMEENTQALYARWYANRAGCGTQTETVDEVHRWQQDDPWYRPGDPWYTGSYYQHEEPDAPRNENPCTHPFVQNPAEAPARLCLECGMWPEHHNHPTAPDGSCVCAECDPNADAETGFRADESLPGYGDDRMYCHSVQEPDLNDRPHP